MVRSPGPFPFPVPTKYRTYGAAVHALSFVCVVRKQKTAVLLQDAIAGAISEYPVNGGDGAVGPIVACFLADQFNRLKNGDRFWYENKDAKFTAGNLDNCFKHSQFARLCPLQHNYMKYGKLASPCFYAVTLR